jgi:hypothetical protein
MFKSQTVFADYDNVELFNQLAAAIAAAGYKVEDGSWRNDFCPKLIVADRLDVFVEYKDLALRENEGDEPETIFVNDWDSGGELQNAGFMADDIEGVLKCIRGCFSDASFATFKASRRLVDDIEKELGFDNGEKLAGYVYADSVYIDRNEAGGHWHLLIERDEWWYDEAELERLEEMLWTHWLEAVVADEKRNAVLGQTDLNAFVRGKCGLAHIEVDGGFWAIAYSGSDTFTVGQASELFAQNLALARGYAAAVPVDAKTERLAKAFAEQIRDALTVSQFRKMLADNAAEPAGSNICHSHDYLDANMVMLAAFQEVYEREPDVQLEADAALWSAAWDLAKRNKFY